MFFVLRTVSENDIFLRMSFQDFLFLIKGLILNKYHNLRSILLQNNDRTKRFVT